MPDCVQCGKELPPDSSAGAPDTCKECRVAANIAASEAARQHARALRGTLRRLTPVTSVIIGINVAVLLGMTLTGGLKALSGPSNRLLLNWGADWGPYTFFGEPWRVFTSMWVHAGLLHLAMNMWCLDVYGRIAERIFGSRFYLAAYLLTGLAGALASLAWHPAAVSIGASAAVFGIVGALVVPYRTGRLPLPPHVLRAASKSLLTFVGYNLLIGFVVPAIDNSAHLGGLLGGVALGALWSRQKDRESNYLLNVCVAAALVIAGAFYTVREVRHWPLLPLASQLDMDHGDNDAAIGKLQKSIAHDSQDTLAYQLLGNAYYRKSDWAKSAGAYEKAISLGAKDEFSRAQLGRVYNQLGRWPDAIAVLQQAVDIDKQDADAWTDLGFAYGKAGRADDAMKAVQTAVQIDPKLARAHASLASMLYERGQFDQAIAEVKEAVSLEPLNKTYANALALAYDKKGLHDAAEKVRKAAGLGATK